jgi:hypothetical protein
MQEPKRIKVFHKIDKDIAEIGWTVMGIEAKPPFCYTIGLQRNYQHPELIVFGLKYEIAHTFLNQIGFSIQAGESYIPGLKYDTLAQGFDTQFIEVLPHHFREYLGTLVGYYQYLDDATSLKALQLVWPDPQNRFPWEEGHDKKFLDFQPLLNSLNN